MNDNLGILLRSQGILNRWRNGLQLTASGEQQKKQTEQGTENNRTQDEKDHAESEYIRHRLAEIAKWERKISGK